MPGLDPSIHVFATRKAWMPGTGPGMTRESARLLLLRRLFALFFRADVFQVRARDFEQLLAGAVRFHVGRALQTIGCGVAMLLDLGHDRLSLQARAQAVSQPPVPESSWPAMTGPCPYSGGMARAVFGGHGLLPISEILLRCPERPLKKARADHETHPPTAYSFRPRLFRGRGVAVARPRAAKSCPAWGAAHTDRV